MTRTLLRMSEVCVFDSEVWLFFLLRVGGGVWHSEYTLVPFVPPRAGRTPGEMEPDL